MKNDYYVYCFFDSDKPTKIEVSSLNCCFLYEPFYIGKGKGERIKSHFYPSSLAKKNLKNNKLKNIINKGKQVLIEKLLNNLTEEDAYDLEKALINSIGRKDLKNGSLTNLCDGGYGIRNCKIESKWKKVYQYDLNGNILNQYISMTQAAEQTGLLVSDISRCCLGKARTHGGFFWSFNSEINFLKNKKNRKVYQFDLKDNQVNKFNSITDASNATGIRCSVISRICGGELISKNSFYFRYEDNQFKLKTKRKTNRAVIQIIENNIIEFESVKEAARLLNITTKSVIKRCSSTVRYDDLNLFYKNDYEKGILKSKLKKGNGEKKIFKLDDRNQILETFDSISAAASSEKISRRHLSRSIDNKKIKGYLYATICNRRAD